MFMLCTGNAVELFRLDFRIPEWGSARLPKARWSVIPNNSENRNNGWHVKDDADIDHKLKTLFKTFFQINAGFEVSAGGLA